ncbi:magnesium transporter CorA family protein [Ramlibacter sp. AN1015]|uniref:magnesium transporter CorA family protein n=1 Tax=Ramlibacter sp. AN1015 TaxID=3133428 RepID=UPI0030C4418C
MQIVEFTEGTLRFLDCLPAAPPARGFVWVYLSRDELREHLPQLQSAALRLGGSSLLDLHVKDLENRAHPSHYDYTSVYDLVVFRRLATSAEIDAELQVDGATAAPRHPSTLASFHRIRTRAVGFAVFDRLLVSVHPAGCETARLHIQRTIAEAAQTEAVVVVGRSRQPSGPADLMLRLINEMVDGYLELRKLLAAELGQWQDALLQPGANQADWKALMVARAELHQLEDLCEEQNDAVEEWLDTVRAQPSATLAQAERDVLVARANDIIEHIRRVAHQVRRMEQGAEAAVQIHFSSQSHRANNIMRTLTALTAIFLPLNLITGIFGMNFDAMPLLHRDQGFWIAIAAMVVLAVSLGVVFWRKRYLSRASR